MCATQPTLCAQGMSKVGDPARNPVATRQCVPHRAGYFDCILGTRSISSLQPIPCAAPDIFPQTPPASGCQNTQRHPEAADETESYLTAYFFVACCTAFLTDPLEEPKLIRFNAAQRLIVQRHASDSAILRQRPSLWLNLLRRKDPLHRLQQLIPVQQLQIP